MKVVARGSVSAGKKRCRLFNANPRLSYRISKTENVAPAVNMKMLLKNIEDKVCLKETYMDLQLKVQ